MDNERRKNAAGGSISKLVGAQVCIGIGIDIGSGIGVGISIDIGSGIGVGISIDIGIGTRFGFQSGFKHPRSSSDSDATPF
ncbi:hypothetical protein [Natrialba magadii]|uniref:hypothetical protein n=1 Tax=Natrialba magadii TaxID=13769 RepID=UPI0011D0E122|nr:hypothetical protein [Natrialba magadii]